MMKRIWFVLLIVALSLTGCAGARTESVGNRDFTGEIEAVPARPPEMTAIEQSIDSSKILEEAGMPQTVDRMVIRNADLSIVVADPAVVMDDIARMANMMGGFVVSSNLYQVTTGSGVKVPQAQITVRVPAEKLDEALAAIKAHVKDPVNDVLSENVSGQDVTQEYTDLQSRLRNLEDAAEQLREILDKATKTEDVLAVFNELKNVNEQIEVLKGQIQYYEQSAKLSAISVSIMAEASVQPINIGGWEPQGAVRRAFQNLIRAYQSIVDGLIWIVIFFLPIAIPIGLVVYFVVRAIRKANRKRKAEQSGETSSSGRE